MSEILVAGIGSPHGADRLGWAVIEALGRRDLPRSVKLASCAQPAELSELLMNARRAVVLDAMLGPGPAGRIHRLAFQDLPGEMPNLFSSHGIGLREAVGLAVALGFEPERLSLVALDVVHSRAALNPAWIEALAEAAFDQLVMIDPDQWPGKPRFGG